MKDYGLVSIITASYNSSCFIAKTIDSILSQTYQHWELLITDDASTDNTVSVIEMYAQYDSRIKVFKMNKNKGAGKCRNNSIEKAQGRFIAFCDSDDYWEPEKLEKQLSFMVQNHFDLTYTSYNVISEQGTRIGRIKCKKRISYKTLLQDNGIGCLTAIYDTNKLGKCYMPSMRKRQDWCLWLSIIKKTRYAYGLSEYLANYRKRKGSVSFNKIEMLKYNYKVYHEFEGYSAFTSFLLLFMYFLPYYFYKKIRDKVLFHF